ncbi:Os03g0562400 [Oryza sativa Japonica Group]|uniref:Os03g0562400 protein n=1 Tax=Oryza sativa subsp. japonica TaxID=39947 RepID=A0A0N7KHI8_ORYSJ|nr:hypothetical protein EE612_018431 [Oryza sativa]BAS84937.1 Os03g0562400 [Oryza sativa Japonica Group]
MTWLLFLPQGCLLPVGLDGIWSLLQSNLAPGKSASYSSLSGQFRRKNWTATSASPVSTLDRRRSSSTTTSATTTTTATSTTSTKATKTTTCLSSLAFSWLITRRHNSAKPEKQKNNAHDKKLSVADWRRSD